MKRLLLFLLSLLIGIGLFIWIGTTIGWQEIKNAFLGFTVWQAAIILGLTLGIIIVSNWRWNEILKGEDVKISFGELFKAYLAGFSIMFLAPIVVWGGELFRSYVLKKKNNISWSKGMTAIIIDRILEWTTNLIVIFFGILIFLFTIGLPPKNLAIIFGGIFLIFACAIGYFYFKIFKNESIAKIFIKIFNRRLSFLRRYELENKIDSQQLLDNNQPLGIEKEIFDFFHSSNKSIKKSFGISFLRAGIMYLRVRFLIAFLGEKIGILPTLSILGFTYLAAMIPIPASLGSHEAIQIFAFNSLGLRTSSATGFTMIIRGAELIVALFGLVILFQWGVDILKKIIFKKN